MRAAGVFAILALPALAQSLSVYSEFAWIDKDGAVRAPEHPREILSPAIVRGGFTSFQIVVEVKSGTSYWLHVGQNPDAFRIAVYTVSARGALSPVDLPFHSDQTQVFWMDVWCDRDAPVRRVKIEPEIAVDGDWVRYPMEARVMEATIPAGVYAPLDIPCPAPTVDFLMLPDAVVVWQLRIRNKRQDAALASHLSKKDLVNAIGGCESTDWSNPESYLKIRDYLFRMR